MAKVVNTSEIYKILTLEDLPNEVWKDIHYADPKEIPIGYYKVSNMGRVKTIARKIEYSFKGVKKIRSVKEKIRKQHLNLRPKTKEPSYLMIRFKFGKRLKSLIIHKLVAKIFVDNSNRLNVVDHRNNIKTDNRSVNLQWTTILENTRMAYKDGLVTKVVGEKRHNSKLTRKQVVQIELVKSTDLTYENIGSMFGVSYGTINDIVRGRSWGHVTGLHIAPLSRPPSWKKNFKWIKNAA